MVGCLGDEEDASSNVYQPLNSNRLAWSDSACIPSGLILYAAWSPHCNNSSLCTSCGLLTTAIDMDGITERVMECERIEEAFDFLEYKNYNGRE